MNVFLLMPANIATEYRLSKSDNPPHRTLSNRPKPLFSAIFFFQKPSLMQPPPCDNDTCRCMLMPGREGAHPHIFEGQHETEIYWRGATEFAKLKAKLPVKYEPPVIPVHVGDDEMLGDAFVLAAE
ncbi:hypothetical protein N2601_12685 [Rhizobium sp. CB3060]|uniref:hypothetical protein n=1 Tax=Rhizobium sp. CB3060 TaxID=3138255 RepID=UPI0021A80CDD|nr:hypothetical protein [Rhizobium tropici]UWU20152.1 hypothetical protein N2601_12685 [Rhizobium tropici]